MKVKKKEKKWSNDNVWSVWLNRSLERTTKMTLWLYYNVTVGVNWCDQFISYETIKKHSNLKNLSNYPQQ